MVIRLVLEYTAVIIHVLEFTVVTDLSTLCLLDMYLSTLAFIRFVREYIVVIRHVL